MVKKLILVDGNNLMFRSYYATAYTGNMMKNSKGVPTNALFGFVSMINKIIAEEKPSYMAVAFDIGKNFRKEEYDFYKYNSTLSNFLNNLTNKYFLNLQKINPKSSPESIMELLKSQLPALYNNENGFDFTLFLSDENYREKTIQEYSVLTKNS